MHSMPTCERNRIGLSFICDILCVPSSYIFFHDYYDYNSSHFYAVAGMR